MRSTYFPQTPIRRCSNYADCDRQGCSYSGMGPREKRCVCRQGFCNIGIWECIDTNDCSRNLAKCRHQDCVCQGKRICYTHKPLSLGRGAILRPGIFNFSSFLPRFSVKQRTFPTFSGSYKVIKQWHIETNITYYATTPLNVPSNESPAQLYGCGQVWLLSVCLTGCLWTLTKALSVQTPAWVGCAAHSTACRCFIYPQVYNK